MSFSRQDILKFRSVGAAVKLWDVTEIVGEKITPDDHLHFLVITVQPGVKPTPIPEARWCTAEQLRRFLDGPRLQRVLVEWDQKRAVKRQESLL